MICPQNIRRVCYGVLALALLVGALYIWRERTRQYPPTGLEAPLRTTSGYTVAFVGDQGLTTDSYSVLKLIKSEQAEAAVLLGDYDYQDNPDAWQKMLEETLGTAFPIIPVIGNHDELKWDGYAKYLTEHAMRTPSITCTGELAIRALCTYKSLSVIVTAPGIARGGHTLTEYEDFIKAVDPKTDWTICAWHKNQTLMQLGDKTNDTGWGVYEACRTHGYPIFTAHEHSYGRTLLLSSIEHQDIVGDSQIKYLLEPGVSFVVVSGLGGHSIRDQKQDHPWWAKVYTAKQGAQAGALFCDFPDDGTLPALCYFKNISGEVVDTFEMSK